MWLNNSMKRWLFARVHPTWHITVFCIGVLSGVVCAQWWNGFSSYSWLVVGILLLLITLYTTWRWCLLLALLAGLCVGIFRGSVDQNDVYYMKTLYGTTVQLTGRVLGDTDTNSRGQRVIYLGDIQAKDRQLAGKVFVSLQGGSSIRRSDIVTVEGKLTDGFGSFVASIYSASVKLAERPVPGDVALQARDWFAGHVHQAIHGSAASLGTGYLLGQKQALSQELEEALKITGLTHIVVASGYNLTILVRLARRLFAKVSRYLAVLASSGLIIGFVGMTGFSPSMSRAGLVAFLSVWAWMYGRRFHPLTLLSAVGAVTVLIDPSYAWGDIGWELSFAAFAGVMIVAPLLQRYFFGSAKPSTLRQILGETVATQLVTAPITMMTFGYISLIAILANLCIVPFVPLAMFLTFVTGIATSIVPSIATIVGAPAQWLLDGMIWVINQCAHMPWAQIEVSMSGWMAIVWYGILALSCYWLIRTTKYSLRETSLVE